MKKLVCLTLASLVSLSAVFAQADHHALSLEARQPKAELSITSIALGQESTIVTAETQMGQYGRVFMTFILAYNAARDGGTDTPSSSSRSRSIRLKVVDLLTSQQSLVERELEYGIEMAH